MIRGIFNWLKRVFGYYEGGVRHSPKRAPLPGDVQDARFDADAATRTEIVRKSRFFEANHWLFNRILDLGEQYVVGANGLQFVPASSNEEFNQRLAEKWAIWCKYPDLETLDCAATIQSRNVRAWWANGEDYIALTRGDTKPSSPRIQVFESHRCETPPALYQQEGKTIIDGIEIDRRGRPVGYWFRTDALEYWNGGIDSTYKRVPAEFVVHIKETSRSGMIHPLPICYPVINDMNDLRDLQVLEMIAAKDQAEKAAFVTNESGTPTSREQQIRQEFSRTTAVDTSCNETAETRQVLYQRILGGRTLYGKKGESITFMAPNRPSGATKDLWDILVNNICSGIGISKLLVCPSSIQGTVGRATYDADNAFFRARSAVMIAAWERVYQYVIEWEINNDPWLSANKPADWRAVTCRPPRAVNADVGYNAAATIAELEAKTTTLEEVWGGKGYDWRERLTQIAKEKVFLTALEDRFSLAPGSMTTGDQVPADKEPEIKTGGTA